MVTNPPPVLLLADPKPLAPASRGEAAARRFKAAMAAPADGTRTPPIDAAAPEPEDSLLLAPDRRPSPADMHPLHPDLGELWDELVLTLQAGQRLSTDHWRLRLRLDPAAFPDTGLVLACTAGELDLTVRTANLAVHARLQAQWPGLEARLRRHARAQAVLQHVPLEELDA